MHTLNYSFSGGTTSFHLGESLSRLKKYADPGHSVIITDERVFGNHGHHLEGWKKILIPSGEDHKNLASLQLVIDGLIGLEADRKTLIIGLGGGVVTDLAGFAAAVYLRGLSCAFVPSSLLAQVDAAIGGKNGVNYGLYKNILGTIRQPQFILFDFKLLDTLPAEEWSNGFAEIIKYACIMDSSLFDLLEQHHPQDVSLIPDLVERSVIHKSSIVREDEFENGKRRWLNFGHTLGHAVEKLHHIAHGQAVSIGMVAAARISEQLSGFPPDSTARLVRLLENYGLPVKFDFDKEAVFRYFRMDKKREHESIHFVLLDRIGNALTMPVSLDRLKLLLDAL